MEWFISLSPVLQGLTATIFTWSVTALGAALVFFFKNVDRKILNSMLGFGAGVMTAASFWSLLNPAIELCGELGYSQFLLPAIGSLQVEYLLFLQICLWINIHMVLYQ